MKNWKSGIIGFVAGATVVSATPVFGAMYKTVSASLMHDVMFQINEDVVASPSDQPVLNYNNYTYVPARFVAESLGCEVGWDPVTRRVTIVPPKQEEKTVYVEKPVEKVVYVDKDSKEGAAVYSKMPVVVRKDGYTITLTSVIVTEEYEDGPKKTRTYVNVENNREDKVELVPDGAKLVLDGTTYTQPADESHWDHKWRQETVKEDEELEGFLYFSDGVEDYSTGSLEFDVRVVDDNQSKTEHIVLNFKK